MSEGERRKLELPATCVPKLELGNEGSEEEMGAMELRGQVRSPMELGNEKQDGEGPCCEGCVLYRNGEGGDFGWCNLKARPMWQKNVCNQWRGRL